MGSLTHSRDLRLGRWLSILLTGSAACGGHTAGSAGAPIDGGPSPAGSDAPAPWDGPTLDGTAGGTAGDAASPSDASPFADGSGADASTFAVRDLPPPPPCSTSVPISPSSPSSVQKGIQAAIDAGCKGVVVPAGTYALPVLAGNWHLGFSNVKDFEIYAKGVSFMLTDATKGGIQFWNCTNVSLIGALFQHVNPPFTQGTIEAIASDGTSYDVQVHAGYYPYDDSVHIPSQPVGYIFDPATRQWKAGTGDGYSTSVEKLPSGLFRIHWPSNMGPPSVPVAVGDYLVSRGNGSTDIYVGGSGGMTITQVTVKNAGGFVAHDDGGPGGNYYSYTVTYGPVPSGGTEAPLVASNADAFHSSGTRVGPTVEGCSFEGMPDDGIPIHGAYCLVSAAAGSTLTLTSTCSLQAGDPVRFYDANGNAMGTASAQSVTALPNYSTAKMSHWNGFSNLSKDSFLQVVVDHTPAQEPAFDWLVANPAANGAGYVVRHNVIRNHRARGMLLKADNGLVEDNVIDGSTIAGIVVSPEAWWNEADYSHNVTIRNNTIQHTGYATVYPGTGQAGALTLTGDATSTPGHQGITIEGNTFQNQDGLNLLIDLAATVHIDDNRFVHDQYDASTRGSSSYDPTALVWVSRSNDVTFSGNTVSQRGAQGNAVVHVASTASSITGATSGFTVMP
jgi:hypothetical protein